MWKQTFSNTVKSEAVASIRRRADNVHACLFSPFAGRAVSSRSHIWLPCLDKCVRRARPWCAATAARFGEWMNEPFANKIRAILIWLLYVLLQYLSEQGQTGNRWLHSDRVSRSVTPVIQTVHGPSTIYENECYPIAVGYTVHVHIPSTFHSYSYG
jgi:hypothetical protein